MATVGHNQRRFHICIISDRKQQNGREQWNPRSKSNINNIIIIIIISYLALRDNLCLKNEYF
jgi:hypothetical protein